MTNSANGTNIITRAKKLTNIKWKMMTQQEQALADDKMRAEIAKLLAETADIHQNMKYRFWVLGAAYVGALGVIVKLF